MVARIYARLLKLWLSFETPCVMLISNVSRLPVRWGAQCNLIVLGCTVQISKTIFSLPWHLELFCSFHCLKRQIPMSSFIFFSFSYNTMIDL